MKTTMLILISCFFWTVGFGQSQGEKLAIEILKQENIAHENLTENERMAKAMDVLDIQKDRKEISEAQFQKNLGILITARQELHQRTIDERKAISESKKAQSKNSEKSSMYDLYRTRLKQKLKDGKMSQVEYDARIENVAKREKESKASGN